MANKTQEITLHTLAPIQLDVTIVGDGDLVLNKMNDVTVKQLRRKI